jgi:hypothetical protein
MKSKPFFLLLFFVLAACQAKKEDNPQPTPINQEFCDLSGYYASFGSSILNVINYRSSSNTTSPARLINHSAQTFNSTPLRDMGIITINGGELGKNNKNEYYLLDFLGVSSVTSNSNPTWSGKGSTELGSFNFTTPNKYPQEIIISSTLPKVINPKEDLVVTTAIPVVSDRVIFNLAMLNGQPINPLNKCSDTFTATSIALILPSGSQKFVIKAKDLANMDLGTKFLIQIGAANFSTTTVGSKKLFFSNITMTTYNVQ